MKKQSKKEPNEKTKTESKKEVKKDVEKYVKKENEENKKDEKASTSKKDDAFREFRRLCAEIANASAYTEKTAIVKNLLTKGFKGGKLNDTKRFINTRLKRRLLPIEITIFSQTLHMSR